MHNRNWMRHNAMVPKGFLRYHVLEALSEKTMSGSEIMEQIEKHTAGFWKPSPGSIYPLLAWLQDNGYIKEMPIENGLKRYDLTENGKTFHEEQKKIHRIVRETGFMPPSFFDTMFMKMPPEKASEVRKALKRFAIASYNLGSTLRESFSEQALNEALSILEEASAKTEALNKKLKGEKVE